MVITDCRPIASMDQPPDTFGVIGSDEPAANGPAVVTLIDGRKVDTESEEYKHECEARFYLSLPLEQRREMLYGKWEKVPNTFNQVVRRGGIRKNRGEAEVKRLEVTMRAIWESRKRRRQAA